MESLNGQPLKRKSLLQMRYPNRKGGARCRIDLVAAGLIKDPVLTAEKDTKNDKNDVDEGKSKGPSLLQLRYPKRKGGFRCRIDLDAVGTLINDQSVPKGLQLAPADSDDAQKDVAGEEGMNPLSIPGIVEKVLSFVENFRDLRRLRLVSKLWMEESLDKWRDTAVFRIDDASEPTLKLTLNVQDDTEPEESMQAVQPWLFETRKKPVPLPPPPPATAVLYRFEEKPFRRYKVVVGSCIPPQRPWRKNKLYFWEKCGHLVRFLHLSSEGHIHIGPNEIAWIRTACPNIKEDIWRTDSACNLWLWSKYCDNWYCEFCIDMEGHHWELIEQDQGYDWQYWEEYHNEMMLQGLGIYGIQ